MLEKKVYIDYDDVVEIPLAAARAEMSFPVSVEKVQSVVSGKILNKSVLFNEAGGPSKNEKVPIGFVSDRRKIINYGDLMDMVVKEVSNVVPCKLIESNISNRNFNVSQRYLLDSKITTPDGTNLSPMLLVNYSYTGVPVSFEIGTFRYVCSNGAVVKVKDLDHMVIKMHDLDSLYVNSIGNVVRRGLDNVAKISDRYISLAKEDWKQYLENLFASPMVSVAFKKKIVEFLIWNGFLILQTDITVKNDTFLMLRYDSAQNSFVDKSGSVVYYVSRDKSAWDFYNDCTDLSSHTSPSVALRRNNDNNISQIFVA